MGKRRPLGERAAANRYIQMLDGRNLTGDKQAALRVAARIFCHFCNLSAVLFERGEMRVQDEAPKLALKTLVDYSDTYLKLVRYALDDAQEDTLADLFGRKEGQ